METGSNWESLAPRVIGHRGASAYAPENTLSAFKKAVELNADAVELDTKLLKDGSVIVLHDNTLNRTTNRTGSVYEFNYQELSLLDAGSHFSLEFQNESIPRLDDVFAAISDDVLVNVELTNYARPWDGLPLAVIELVRKFELEKVILLSSFNPWALIQAKRISPAISRALLIDNRMPGFMQAFLQAIVDCTIFHPHHSLIDAKSLSKSLKNYTHVNVWTVNDRRRLRELVTLGVSGIITDHPDIAADVWNEISQS